MTPGICENCQQFKAPYDSHSIPNAVFRPLLTTTLGSGDFAANS